LVVYQERLIQSDVLSDGQNVKDYKLRFDFLKAMVMVAAVWDAKPCSQNRTDVSEEPARIISYIFDDGVIRIL
jgi:hypothetical protein